MKKLLFQGKCRSKAMKAEKMARNLRLRGYQVTRESNRLTFHDKAETGSGHQITDYVGW